MSTFVKLFLLLFLLFVLVVICRSFPTNGDRKENSSTTLSSLELVHIIFRHGKRTTYKFYPKDPHRNETFYPIGLGGLTNDGKMGEYKLGKFLRNYYNEFLGDVYTEDKIYVRSTDVTRTKMSAELVLAGLWPPAQIQIWNENLQWQPIVVDFKPAAQEDLIHPTNCDYKKQVLENMINVPEVQEKFLNPSKKLFDYIEEHSGMKINDIHDMLDFYFILSTEDELNMALPEWTKEIYPEPVYSVASRIYEYHNFDPQVKKINAGYLLQKILNDTHSKIASELTPNTRKMFLYSGHETTIGYTLEALKLLKPHVPPYGSALFFEIHKKDDQHFIKIRYRDSPGMKEPADFDIEGCGVLCPLQKFEELYKDLLPTVDVKEACTVKNEDKKET